MSTVQQINPNFQSKGVTPNNNIYDKTNIGKYIGAAAGLAYGGYHAVGIYRQSKTPEFKDWIAGYLESFIEQIKKIDKNFNLSETADIRETPLFKKGLKWGKAAAIIFALAIPAAIGLGFGAIGDKIANVIKAKKVDNANSVKSE